MALWQGRSSKKITGGRYRPLRKKLKREISRELQFTGIGPRRMKTIRTRGNNRKFALLTDTIANVMDPGNHISTRAKVVQVVENISNPNYVRRNMITKGAILETERGYAKVTSRPGQDGILNAVLVPYIPPPSKKQAKRLRKKEKTAA
jgi:small subunit ribosomal protein S8e